MARAKGLAGWVNNSTDGVHIEITTDKTTATNFTKDIIRNAPRLSTILHHSIEETNFHIFHEFEIINSNENLQANLPLTPDFALCDDCRKEIGNKNNRRYDYSFTTCTNCGPRYSIVKKMPYDRHNTTMDVFNQCPDCAEEYNNPLDRRHFSQTNSCTECGIRLFNEVGPVNIDQIVKSLRKGSILAIKGIGGFLLVTDANNRASITELRKRKNRPHKPFAVMYPSIEAVKSEFIVNNHIHKQLTSEISPIVLLEPKSDDLSIDQAGIAPGLKKIGIMIPYAPLFQLIFNEFRAPLIATSGNISGSPIIYTNNAAKEELSQVADEIIMNDREIVIPQDDSVIGFVQPDRPVILRRSRGMAPTLLNHKLVLPQKSVLAMGADMKSSFALTQHDYLYVSQYLGDMDSYLTQSYFEKTLNHLKSVLNHSSEIVLVDSHPAYFSTNLGKEIANQYILPSFSIQHHKAHFYAVLGEHGLLETSEPVLGVIWDGTGYGEDGMIWGGEFFSYQHKKVKRIAHLPYLPFILGDKMPREPRISALSLLAGASTSGSQLSLGNAEIPTVIKEKFTEQEIKLYQPMLENPTLQTSSMGRLFDAIASLVLGINKTSYEGQAAMLLEKAANDSLKVHRKTPFSPYQVGISEFQQSLFKEISDDLENKISPAVIALKFHLTLVNLIRQKAEKSGIKKLAFSGGVFQNTLLVSLILDELGTDFNLFFHEQLSPNDENISYGQIAWYSMHEKELDR